MRVNQWNVYYKRKREGGGERKGDRYNREREILPSLFFHTGCTECEHLEESLTNSKAEILKLRSALTSSEDKIHLLDHQLEELDTKFSEEVQIRDEQLSKQGSELESKANTIAMLTQQLYNTQVRLRNELQLQAKNVNTTTATSSPATSSAVCVCPHCHVHRKKPAVTGDRYCALSEGIVPVDYQMSTGTATGTSSRSRISRIQRRHFRNSSSPAAQDVRNLSEPEDNNYYSPSKTATGTKRLPTPPLTPRPPPTTAAFPAPSMIRRASNPIRKQSPSPRSSRGQASSSGGSRSVMSRASVASLTDESAQSCASISMASVSNEGKMLDPVQVYRQGVMPQELRELLQSRERGDLGEQLQQLLISKPAPLPPIVSDDDNDQTTPTQSEIFHYDPATMMIDPNNFTMVHPSNPLTSMSSRFNGHPHPHAHHHNHHPAGTRQHHRHIILAKAQGLSSAPSTVRLLRYSPAQQQQQDLMREEVGGASGSGLLVESKEGVIEDKEREAAEGTLLVKEAVDRKDSALQELHQR